MPKDKTYSHEKINKAIYEEFLEKGYEAASVRSIADRAGMTAAGLYRHYPDKEAMFTAFVKPLIDEIDGWLSDHKKNHYDLLESGVKDRKQLMENSNVDLIRDVLYPNKEVFRILVNGAKGTMYENYVHDFVNRQQADMKEVLQKMKKYGFNPNIPGDEEMHIIFSAYVTAGFEPIIHNYSKEKMESCLEAINRFFAPGWMNMMGL